MANRFPVFTTIGMEYELEDVVPRDVQGLNIGDVGFSTTHDASCESDGYKFSNLSIILQDQVERDRDTDDLLDLGSGSKITLGTELVSTPIDMETDDILDVMKKLTHYLSIKGERPESFRGSVHFHVSCPFNLQILKNIIKLGRFMEDVFFYIGGQGYTFRGQAVNESQYCRPITKWGPQCVPIQENRTRYSQLYNVEELLKTKTSDQFWDYYGCTDPGNTPRYFHVRYTWLNLYSLLVHGSLEFRVFNKTLNPHYLNAEVELCKKFSEAAVYLHNMNFVEEENSIFDERPKSDIILTLERFADITNLSSYTVEILTKIIQRTPTITLPRRYIFSHMIGRQSWSFFNRHSPKLILSPTDISPAPVLDIHAIHGENVSGSRAEIRSPRLSRTPIRLNINDDLDLPSIDELGHAVSGTAGDFVRMIDGNNWTVGTANPVPIDLEEEEEQEQEEDFDDDPR